MKIINKFQPFTLKGSSNLLNESDTSPSGMQPKDKKLTQKKIEIPKEIK